MSPACGPIVSQQPKITSSTAPGSTPVRSTSALSTCAPRSAGWTRDEPAAALADRGAHRVDDVGLCHGSASSQEGNVVPGAERRAGREHERRDARRGGSAGSPHAWSSDQARRIQMWRSCSQV